MIALFCYILLSFTYLGLGILFAFTKAKQTYLKRFFVLTVLFPFTPIVTALHTRFQITAYYFFLIPVFIWFILKTLSVVRVSKTGMFSFLLATLFIISYLLYDVSIYPENLDLINLLKDIKPLLFLGVIILLFSVFKDVGLSWEDVFTKRLLMQNAIFSMIIFIIFFKTNVVGSLTADPFYQRVEIRYLSMGTFFSLFYFINKLGRQEKFVVKELIYILIPIFLSGNRTLFLVLLFIVLLNVFLSIGDVQSFFRKAFLISTGGVLLVTIVFSFNENLKNRIATLLDMELVIKQLQEFRFAPFLNKLHEYNWYDYIFGKGIGATFFIPWFVYRKNIDNYNTYMDNIYLTLYMKYGLFSIIIFFILYLLIAKNTPNNKRYRLFIIIYFLVMGLTTAYMYQINFLFILIMLAAFDNEKIRSKNNSRTEDPPPMIE